MCVSSVFVVVVVVVVVVWFLVCSLLFVAFLLLCLTILVTIALSCRFHSSRGDGEQPVRSQSAVNTNTPLICSAVRCDKKLHTKERVRVDPWGWPEPGGLAQPDGSSHMLAPPGAYCDIGRSSFQHGLVSRVSGTHFEHKSSSGSADRANCRSPSQTMQKRRRSVGCPL